VRLAEADPLPANPYTELRRRLLAAHQLTDIQRVEQLFNLPPLAAQKPLELLAEMLRLCPRGQEKNAFFNCLFLNKLPRELHESTSCFRRRTCSPPTTNYCLAGLKNNKGLFSIRFPYPTVSRYLAQLSRRFVTQCTMPLQSPPHSLVRLMEEHNWFLNQFV
jgi:hypothetical protein